MGVLHYIMDITRYIYIKLGKIDESAPVFGSSDFSIKPFWWLGLMIPVMAHLKSLNNPVKVHHSSFNYIPV